MTLEVDASSEISIKCAAKGDPFPTFPTLTFDDIYGSTDLSLDDNGDRTCSDM